MLFLVCRIPHAERRRGEGGGEALWAVCRALERLLSGERCVLPLRSDPAEVVREEDGGGTPRRRQVKAKPVSGNEGLRFIVGRGDWVGGASCLRVLMGSLVE